MLTSVKVKIPCSRKIHGLKFRTLLFDKILQMDLDSFKKLRFSRGLVHFSYRLLFLFQNNSKKTMRTLRNSEYEVEFVNRISMFRTPKGG
jgi:hypothetical protein